MSWLCFFFVYGHHLGFGLGVDHLFEILLCGESFRVRLLVGLPVLFLNSIWLTDCATYFIVSSIMSPCSVPKSELDCGEIELTTDLKVLWFIGGGMQMTLNFVFWTAPCTCIEPVGGCLMEGMCNSALTLLPLSSLTFNEEGSGSFASNHFSSLVTWLFSSAIMFYIWGY